jgi:hypothetical protein
MQREARARGQLQHLRAAVEHHRRRQGHRPHDLPPRVVRGDGQPRGGRGAGGHGRWLQAARGRVPAAAHAHRRLQGLLGPVHRLQRAAGAGRGQGRGWRRGSARPVLRPACAAPPPRLAASAPAPPASGPGPCSQGGQGRSAPDEQQRRASPGPRCAPQIAATGKRVHILLPDQGEYQRSYKMWVALHALLLPPLLLLLPPLLLLLPLRLRRACGLRSCCSGAPPPAAGPGAAHRPCTHHPSQPTAQPPATAAGSSRR